MCQKSLFSLRVVRSPGGCTVTACTRPYRHFRHPRASTSLQLDGSNWTANGRVVIRTRHLSANPFAPSPSPSLLRHPGNLLPKLLPGTGVSRDTSLRVHSITVQSSFVFSIRPSIYGSPFDGSRSFIFDIEDLLQRVGVMLTTPRTAPCRVVPRRCADPSRPLSSSFPAEGCASEFVIEDGRGSRTRFRQRD